MRGPPVLGQVDSLPGGVVRVINTLLEDRFDPGHAWRLVEELRVGAVDGDGPDVFGSIRSLAVDADGGACWTSSSLPPLGRGRSLDGSSGVSICGRVRWTRAPSRPSPTARGGPRLRDVDPRGRLWVQVEAPDGGMRFDIFGADGRWQGSAASSLPLERFAPRVVEEDRLTAVVTDSLGVAYVVRMRLEREG